MTITAEICDAVGRGRASLVSLYRNSVFDMFALPVGCIKALFCSEGVKQQ